MQPAGKRSRKEETEVEEDITWLQWGEDNVKVDYLSCDPPDTEDELERHIELRHVNLEICDHMASARWMEFL